LCLLNCVRVDVDVRCAAMEGRKKRGPVVSTSKLRLIFDGLDFRKTKHEGFKIQLAQVLQDKGASDLVMKHIMMRLSADIVDSRSLSVDLTGHPYSLSVLKDLCLVDPKFFVQGTVGKVAEWPFTSIGTQPEKGFTLWMSGCFGVRAADWCPGGGTSDPYCTCEFAGKTKTLVKTKHIDDNLCPVWNHKSEMKDYTVGDNLIFKVYDSDFGKTDDFLGIVTLNSEQYHPQGFSGHLKLDDAGDGIDAYLVVEIPPTEEWNDKREKEQNDQAKPGLTVKTDLDYQPISSTTSPPAAATPTEKRLLRRPTNTRPLSSRRQDTKTEFEEDEGASTSRQDSVEEDRPQTVASRRMLNARQPHIRRRDGSDTDPSRQTRQSSDWSMKELDCNEHLAKLTASLQQLVSQQMRICEDVKRHAENAVIQACEGACADIMNGSTPRRGLSAEDRQVSAATPKRILSPKNLTQDRKTSKPESSPRNVSVVEPTPPNAEVPMPPSSPAPMVPIRSDCHLAEDLTRPDTLSVPGFPPTPPVVTDALRQSANGCSAAKIPGTFPDVTEDDDDGAEHEDYSDQEEETDVRRESTLGRFARGKLVFNRSASCDSLQDAVDGISEDGFAPGEEPEMSCQNLVPMKDRALPKGANNVRSSDMTGSFRLSEAGRESSFLTDGKPRASNRRTGARLTEVKEKSKEALRTTRTVGTNESDAKVQGNLFIDQENLKRMVRAAIDEHEYDVRDYYWETGVFQRIARSNWFDTTTLSVIAGNSLWMWIDTDHNDAVLLKDAHPVFQIAEHFVCFYFFAELIIRFLSFESKLRACMDYWFLFDTTLVTMMLVETWIMALVIEILDVGPDSRNMKNASVLRVLRLMRIFRMARLVRLVRAMPELMILIKGMAMAARSVCLTMMLLALIIYVFAIGLTQVAQDTDSEFKTKYFGSVPDSMNTLLLHGCFGEELPDVVNTAGRESILFGAIIILFVLIASLTVMNLLVGVLVEVVSVVASVEKETLQVTFVKTKVLDTLHEIDANMDGNISRSEFESLLFQPTAAKALQEVGVDVVGLVDFSDFIFADGDEISFYQFMDTVLQLRGSNMATVKDICDLRKWLTQELNFRIPLDAYGNPLYFPQ